MLAACAHGAPPSPRELVITHVTVIDPETGPHPDMTIVIRGTRIADVGPASGIALPPHAEIYDATGAFALPGLWDSHVHLSQIGAEAFPMFVANGVTSVRDMGSDLTEIAGWKRARQAGELIPRIISPGAKLDGAGDPSNDTRIITTPSDARRAVDELKAAGADFIKVHANLTRPVYDAIAAECRQQRLAFAGHVSPTIDPLTAAAAGQLTIEHGHAMLPCSAEQRRAIPADPVAEWIASFCRLDGQPDLLAALARSGVRLTPTLASWRGKLLDGPASQLSLDGAGFVSAHLEQHWRDMSGPPITTPLQRDLISQFAPLAAAADRAGVPLLAGTDLGDPYVIPGFTLHDELALLVAAGVPPLHAIRSATLEPAVAFGFAASLGSIAPGKAADLLLVGADPLTDIRNTRKITAVVLDGRLLREPALRALIEPLRRAP